jgi:hypothetical protein
LSSAQLPFVIAAAQGTALLAFLLVSYSFSSRSAWLPLAMASHDGKRSRSVFKQIVIGYNVVVNFDSVESRQGKCVADAFGDVVQDIPVAIRHLHVIGVIVIGVPLDVGSSTSDQRSEVLKVVLALVTGPPSVRHAKPYLFNEGSQRLK